MNAPAEPAATRRPPQRDCLALDQLRPSATHIQQLRRKRFDADELAELAESVRKVGVLQPILVRAIAGAGTLDATHEIVAGERRWIAAGQAGLIRIDVNVAELSDEQVLEVQLIENLQRKDLHELEEAEGYDELKRIRRITFEQVADLVGKSRSYVHARTRLLALCPEARKAFYAGEISASIALLIARIGHHDTQRSALADVVKGVSRFDGGRRPGEPMSFREARDHLALVYTLKLKGAAFDPNDASLLPKAGACQACPKRTGNLRELFPDIKDPDVCTDPKCFDDKRQAHFAKARQALEARGEKVIADDAAKKLLPNWDDSSEWRRNALANGYQPLDSETYVAGRGRKVGELLGRDFKPTLLQHPRTGQIIKIASAHAIAAAAGKNDRARGFDQKKAKPKGPDVDEDEFKALLKLIHGKLQKDLTRPQLLVMARKIFNSLNLRRYGDDAICAAWGWKSSALDSPGYSEALPRTIAELSTPDLMKFFFEAAFATCYSTERKAFLSLFDINEAKVRRQVIEQRKQAATRTKSTAKGKKK